MGTGKQLAMVAVLLISAGSAVRSAEPPAVLTMLDYFEGGRRAVDGYLEDRTRRDLRRIVERARQSCVRVEIRYEEDADRYRSLAASGVLVDGGRRVLTAGHFLAGIPDGTTVLVKLIDGETRSARATDRRYEIFGGADADWAVLELLGPPIVRFPSAVPGGVAEEGQLALVLGYPDQIGIDAEGRVTFDGGPEARFLEPLLTLGRVGRRAPLRLTPFAGAVPTTGMSGAPVFDRRGRLVGIFVSLRKVGTRDEVSYRYNVASLDAVIPALPP